MAYLSILTWIKPDLPTISGLTWYPGWPEEFTKLPVGCFRLADNSTGVTTSAGQEGSASVAVYIDTWAKTPELRESYDAAVSNAITVTGMVRRMVRHTEEVWADGTRAFRSTILFAGEYDHGMGRMCAP